MGKTVDKYAEEWYDSDSLIHKVFESEEGWSLFVLMSLREHYGKEVLKTLEDVDPGFLEKVLDDAFFEGMKE